MLISLQIPIEESRQEYVPMVFLSSPFAGVSPYLENQFPEFVRDDHQKFITFMKAYYEWMEADGNVLHSSKKLKYYQDIDYSKPPFTEKLFREFLVNFPRTLATDYTTLLKNIKDFYRAKGTEKSFEMFFRAAYGLNPEFYYPRVDILRVSDGKWIQQKSLRVFSSVGNPLQLSSLRVRGKDSNSTAYVEKVFIINEGQFSGYELSLNRSSITGNFLPEDVLVSEDGEIEVIVSAVPSKITIKNPGLGYTAGTKFKLNVVGSGAEIEIQSVSSLGEIESFRIVNYGLGYKSYLPLVNYTLLVDGASSLAVIDVEYDSLITYSGYYLNEDGQISTLKYLQDGEYYQAFSYVVYVDDTIESYRDSVKQLLHPAGFKLYGGFRSQNILDAKVHIANEIGTTSVRLYNNGIPINAKIKSVITHVKLDTAALANSLSATNYSIEQNKFNYKPFDKYDANEEILGIPNYFGLYGNLSAQRAITPISAFDELGIKLSDIIDAPMMKTNIMPDAVIKTETI